MVRTALGQGVGPDMGTNEIAMGWIKDEIGRAAGLPTEIGGIPLDEIGATGYGVVYMMEDVLGHLGEHGIRPGEPLAIQEPAGRRGLPGGLRRRDPDAAPGPAAASDPAARSARRAAT